MAAALGAVLLVWAVWAGWRYANPDVVAKVVKFKVVSDTRIDAEVTVQRSDVTTRVTCQVSAQAISYDTVGQLPFTWESNGQELQTQWVTIKTFKTPVTAVVDWCKVAA